MGKLNMNLLKGIEEQENAIDKSRQVPEETNDSIYDTPQHPQHLEPLTTQEQKKLPSKIETNDHTTTKPPKAVMGFRAEIEKMEDWKLYASVTGQEIGMFCSAAIEEYISRHKLNPEQQELFDLKKQAIKIEKKMKNS